MSVTTIDTEYAGFARVAAAYLIREGERAAFVETNTTHAVPRLLEALASEGMTPEQVEWVIVTHVHLDHSGGASALLASCPNATLLCHPRAAPHLIDPTKLVKSSKEVYGEAAFEKLYGTIEPIDEARVRIMGDGEVLRWGSRELTFLHTRGHANHHFCVLDSGSEGIFTGDSFGLYYPDLQEAGLFTFPTTTPTDFDAAAAKESVKRIAASGAKRAFFTHFGESERLDEIAAQLLPQLEVFGGVVDDADASGLEGDELDEVCERAVRLHFDDMLEARGLDRPDIRERLELDVSLNAQGLAFAVKKRRFKRQRA